MMEYNGPVTQANDAIDDLSAHASELISRASTIERRLDNLLDRLGFPSDAATAPLCDTAPHGLRFKLQALGSELSAIEARLNAL